MDLVEHVRGTLGDEGRPASVGSERDADRPADRGLAEGLGVAAQRILRATHEELRQALAAKRHRVDAVERPGRDEHERVRAGRTAAPGAPARPPAAPSTAPRPAATTQTWRAPSRRASVTARSTSSSPRSPVHSPSEPPCPRRSSASTVQPFRARPGAKRPPGVDVLADVVDEADPDVPSPDELAAERDAVSRRRLDGLGLHPSPRRWARS